MSRHFRSGLVFVQNPAGPSTLRPTYLPRPCQSRSASNFASILPSWMRRKAPTPVQEANATTEVSETTGSLFDEVAKEARSGPRKAATEHKYKSAHHKISHRKLNDLSRQIQGLPVDEAIVQMEFSEKRASSWIKSTLCLARDHAMDKGLQRSKMIVAETWVSKGQKLVRADIKGRGRTGRKEHPSARIHFLLKEGKSKQEQEERQYQKAMGQIRSAGVVREDGVIRRKVVSGWTW